MATKSISELSFATVGFIFIIGALIFNVWMIEKFFTSDGEIASSFFRALIWLFQLSCATAGITALILRTKLRWGKIALFAVALLFSLMIGELALRLLYPEPTRPILSDIPELSDRWSVDSVSGMHAIYDKMKTSGKIMHWNKFNHAGFRDHDEFTPGSFDTSAFKILLLEDSFTYGASAFREGECFADVLEANLCHQMNVVIWNTGMPGIGQRQEINELETYFPILRPQLVILGFCLNDFADNLWPPGEYYIFMDGCLAFRYARVDDSLVVLSPQAAYRRANPIILSGGMQSLRICQLAKSAVKALMNRYCPFDPSGNNYKQTELLLSEIAGYIQGHNSKLLVMIIPSLFDVKRYPTRDYSLAVSICQDLGIECFRPLPLLRVADYVDLPMDEHWNKFGHKKVGSELAKWVVKYGSEKYPQYLPQK